MHAYIALGSNLEEPIEQIQSAIVSLAEHAAFKLLKHSSLYKSQALTVPGSEPQPDYINAVVLIETPLSAQDLLLELQQIELKYGRVRDKKWAARTLDLDILLYGATLIDSNNLQIPHPRMTERNFVIYPLAEISPALDIPNIGSIENVLCLVSYAGLQKIDS